MRQTVTFIPGSFKPPTKAHWKMIDHYAGLSDRVVVLISAPKAAVRTSAGEASGDVTPQKSKAILDAFRDAFDANNVEIRISDDPSPVKQLMKEVSGLHNAVIIIGTSDKGGDSMRYDWLPDRFTDRQDLKIMLPSDTAFHATDSMSAGDARRNMADFEFYRKMLPGGLPDETVETIRKILYDG